MSYIIDMGVKPKVPDGFVIIESTQKPREPERFSADDNRTWRIKTDSEFVAGRELLEWDSAKETIEIVQTGGATEYRVPLLQKRAVPANLFDHLSENLEQIPPEWVKFENHVQSVSAFVFWGTLFARYPIRARRLLDYVDVFARFLALHRSTRGPRRWEAGMIRINVWGDDPYLNYGRVLVFKEGTPGH